MPRSTGVVSAASLLLALAACSNGSAPAEGVTSSRLTEIVLTPAQKGAIANEVRSCWIRDNEGQGAAGTFVLIKAVTNAHGTVELAEIAPSDQARVTADPALQVFAMRAVRALLDSRCATLPLPANLIGAPHSFVFRISP